MKPARSPASPRSLRTRLAAPLLALGIALAGCTSGYTGPVEVTRFVSEQRSALGSGAVTLEFPEEMTNMRARSAFAEAVSRELGQLGYSVVMQSGPQTQIAAIRTSREPFAAATRRRGPVNVGVGGSTGSYGSGVGLGVGINLGGNSSAPDVVSSLSVRISDPAGQSLWEGRASQQVSMNSPYADVEASADALAAALFRDFPGGNGETVTVEVEDLPPR